MFTGPTESFRLSAGGFLSAAAQSLFWLLTPAATSALQSLSPRQALAFIEVLVVI